MMGVFRVTLLWLLVASLLLGCASVSEKKFKLAEQSMARGNFSQAFDQAALSLKADIKNYNAIVLFADVMDLAYQQRQSKATAYQVAVDWDHTAYAYDQIVAMNASLKAIQSVLSQFSDTVSTTKPRRDAMNKILLMTGADVSRAHAAANNNAAAGHYLIARQQAEAKAYRLAQAEFAKALAFVRPYKEAEKLLVKYKHLADLADAKRFYNEAKQAVQMKQHRPASVAFARAESFITGFKDARLLAAKYKDIADHEDALANYDEGQRLAQNTQYRAAVRAFETALSFVPDFRDASSLVWHYTDLANKQDARRHYNRAMDLMDHYDFEAAARAFDQADAVVSGFRDAREMASRARAFVPPPDHALKALVQASVKHGVPLSWLHDVHRGYTEDVVITNVRVLQKAGFHERREYWPYRLQVAGTCDLEISKTNEQKLTFNTVVDFRIYRNDFGEWQASFR